jgi:hypothetical protein
MSPLAKNAALLIACRQGKLSAFFRLRLRRAKPLSFLELGRKTPP